VAQVTTDTERRIDQLLDLLLAAWAELPHVEPQIDTGDLLDQIDYVEDWGAKEALREELDGYALAGLLSEDQQQRYAELQHLLEMHLPIVGRLRSS